INALLFIPQAINIYKTKSAKGLSLTTFAGFNIMQIFTILHAYLRNDYVLMFGMGLSFIFCGITTLFIIKYR
ncbi:MAG: hypothetical protein LBQ13_01985, partial [Endomicrobium sp.]|nr:hypothetical protein [Endomicrobium sp.]